MSLPRQILPGVVYLLTRRTAQRQFLLRPDKHTNQTFRFCLAVAAERFNISIHAYCVLSNHYHIVLTDHEGTLPAFAHWLNEYVAKCVNARLGRWEAFWAPGSYSAVRLAGFEAISGRMVYTYTNPVSSGLVRSARQWPGAKSLPTDGFGQIVEIVRPEGFFRERGPVPEVARLSVSLPAALVEETADPVEALKRAVAEKERELRASGMRFLGRRRVLDQSPFARPRTRARRRGLNPRVAERDKWRRIETLQRLREFIESYRNALTRFAGGEWDVCFPRGTYLLRVRFNVRVAAVP